MLKFTKVDPRPFSVSDAVGYIPTFLDESDPRSVEEQINERYVYGGFQRFNGFKMKPNGDLTYPGDPVTKVLCEATLREEVIRVYEHAWVSITQANGSFVVARLD